jgi:signal peptidase I
MHKIMKILSFFFTAVAAAVVAVVVSVFALMKGGYLPQATGFVVLSGSMEPSIGTGSVVIVQKALQTFSIGEVITFKRSGGDPVTHRVTSVKTENGETMYETKGDANNAPDASLVSHSQVLGNVVWTLPHVGKFIALGKTPAGFILMVIIPATLVVYEELRSVKHELAKSFKKSKSPLSSASLPAVSLGRDPLPLVAAPLPWDLSRFYAFLPRPFAYAQVPAKQVVRQSNKRIYAAVIPIVAAAGIGVAVTTSYFSDHEVSSSNVLGASEDFSQTIPDTNNLLLTNGQDSIIPTPSPTLVPTPTPQPSPTPTSVPTPTPTIEATPTPTPEVSPTPETSPTPTPAP